ncbi:MAG: 2Fe-2S iron-sulfur cluster binding domain-containing protein [Ideonella sp.]|jgi:ferredoxin|nr:2Fe-2S iron-sulfur cluster binding domain-containing protein [Ideonella sp.]MBL0150966.1 2Fe-2S iron-sulfur cluster binding domain-containing protein [Ideonella sp.]
MATAHTITIADDGQTYRCSEQRSLLEGMEQLGRKGIPVGCRNGGCGVCKVEILSGCYSSRVMSREHVSEEDEALGRVLACRVKPTSDIRLAVIGKMKRSVCRTVESADANSSHST